ncbi:MAG: (Fe-S)-binding protein [bacterium]|nr:(Fe-S)-binding protein [bacterium]
MATTYKYIKIHEEELAKCMKCGNCRSICPVFEVENEETMVARGKLRLVEALLNQEINLSSILIDRIYNCLNCGVCLRSCPGNVDASKIIISARCEIAKEDLLPQLFKEQRENIIKDGNPFGEKRSERVLGNIQKTNIKKSKNLYFIGCSNSYVSKEIPQSVQKILKTINYGFVTLGNLENCCGEPLNQMGENDLYKKLINENRSLFKNLGIESIFTSCAKCFKNLKENYSSEFEILHTSQLFYKLICQNKFKFKPYPQKVIYFDGCNIGRRGGVFEEPRSVLRKVPELKLLEFNSHHQDSLCCGGPFMDSYCDLAENIAVKRIEGAIKKEADLIITSCPTCFANLKKGVLKAGLNIGILDLPVFLSEVIQ